MKRKSALFASPITKTSVCHLALLTLVACGGRPVAGANTPRLYRGGDAPHSQAAARNMLTIPAGRFVAGSTAEEREEAYLVFRDTAGHEAARRGKWFDREEDRHVETIAAYRIDQTPVNNAAFAEFVVDTGIEGPFISADDWKAQRFTQDYMSEVARFNWDGQSPPRGREEHPVVLVPWHEADAYCKWRGELSGVRSRLPTAHEYERAARGDSGLFYPWGNVFDKAKLNSGLDDNDTTAVGSYPEGVSPHGMLDAAGNIFQWTKTPWRAGGDPYAEPVRGKMTVKGSAWDDFGGVGRGAAQHGRKTTIRHAIVGFRCAADAPRK